MSQQNANTFFHGGDSMTSNFLFLCIVGTIVLRIAMSSFPSDMAQAMEKGETEDAQTEEGINLPAPTLDGGTSIEASLLSRRSVRHFIGSGLTLNALSQLLWAAQGVTDPRGFRTAPSAGALYPLEITVVAGHVSGLGQGVYRYDPDGHALVKTGDRDRREALWRAALEQPPVRYAPLVVVFCGVYERTTRKYGERGIRYVHMEAGHAAQNVSLQAVSLGLGTVPIGAFRDEQVKSTLGLKSDESPLYLLPVGALEK
jgi:SagB-type dehydrogenase family enzyme